MFGSTWEWIRIAGFLAYFYFTVAVIFGLLRKSASIKSAKNLIYHTHIYASWGGFFALIAHMLLLMIDTYQPYSISDLLIPFSNDYAPILSGFGIIAFYLFLIVIFTSDILIKKLKRNIWKGIHFLVLPAWGFSLLHGLFIGTDRDNPLILLFYIITASLTGLVVILRFVGKDEKKKETTQSTRSNISKTSTSH